MKEQDAAHSFDKHKAIELMKNGRKVRHRLFEAHDWITLQDGLILSEDGIKQNEIHFWNLRTMPEWETGWNLVEDKELDTANDIIKELKMALITRDGKLTNKVMFEELTRLRSELQQERENVLREAMEYFDEFGDKEKFTSLQIQQVLASLIKKAKLNN